MNVLVIEDHEGLRSILSETLRNRPTVQQVCACAHGRCALDLIDEFHPDVIISDYTLPDMTGLDVLRELKQRVPNAVTVICSVGVPRVAPSQEEWLGEHIFCDKAEDLLRCLLEVLEKHRQSYG